MKGRTAKILLIVTVALALTGVRPAACGAWSLLNPFGSSKDAPPPKKPAVRPAAKQPSTFDKIAAGTKNLFTKPAEALGLKKPAPKKRPTYATPVVRQPKNDAPKSGIASWFQPKEPDRGPPQSPKDWIGGQRPEF